MKRFLYLSPLLWGLCSAFNGDTCSDIAAKFSYKTTGLVVSFNNRSEGNIVAHLWQFDDGNTSTEINPTHTFAKGGLHTFSLTVSNASGCSETFEGKLHLFVP
ncbi:MAG: PKD domain-containing protein [Sphingobacteriales bacterium]|nr:PKD domain-containing protein [Sphingobacteriales bacterium]